MPRVLEPVVEAEATTDCGPIVEAVGTTDRGLVIKAEDTTDCGPVEDVSVLNPFTASKCFYEKMRATKRKAPEHERKTVMKCKRKAPARYQ